MRVGTFICGCPPAKLLKLLLVSVVPDFGLSRCFQEQAKRWLSLCRHVYGGVGSILIYDKFSWYKNACRARALSVAFSL